MTISLNMEGGEREGGMETESNREREKERERKVSEIKTQKPRGSIFMLRFNEKCISL